MIYEKAFARIIEFDSNEFMTWSGGTAGQQAAEAAAVDQPAIQAELRLGNRHHVESSNYDPLTGNWTVKVNVYNKGDHLTLSKTYVFDANGNVIQEI